MTVSTAGIRESPKPLTALDIVHQQIRERRLKADDATVVAQAEMGGVGRILECQPDWQEHFLKLPVFESGVWRARLGYAPAYLVGSAGAYFTIARTAVLLGI